MDAAASLSRLLPKPLRTAEQIRAELEFQRSGGILPLGIPELDAALPHQGLPFGNVIELQTRGASGAATSFALCACRAAQHQASMGSEQGSRWCAFVDPTGTLFAPGISQLGVDLRRLLVVRPDASSVERVAVRIAEAKLVSMLVIDLQSGSGGLGQLTFQNRKWQSTVRRLSLAVQRLSTCVLLLTGEQSSHVLPLPVAMRLELRRVSPESFEVRVGKERTGRISQPRTVAWSSFESSWRPSRLVTALHDRTMQAAAPAKLHTV